jgi:hypothetical protein
MSLIKSTSRKEEEEEEEEEKSVARARSGSFVGIIRPLSAQPP